MAPIVCLVLYGSHARGDGDERSDVDLLAVADGGAPSTAFGRHLNFSRYPLELVLRRARSGDLFALHLVSEGRVVFEREPVFAMIKRAFCYRSDYARGSRLASDAGWFLLHHRDRAVDEPRFNRWMAWCTRTMIVSRAATARQPVFSADGLAALAGSDGVATVIRSKRSAAVDPAVLELFRDVLVEFGGPEPQALDTLSAEWHRFRAQRNPAGSAAIRAMLPRPRSPIDLNPM
jgi:hypothetical protein